MLATLSKSKEKEKKAEVEAIQEKNSETMSLQTDESLQEDSQKQNTILGVRSSLGGSSIGGIFQTTYKPEGKKEINDDDENKKTI